MEPGKAACLWAVVVGATDLGQVEALTGLTRGVAWNRLRRLHDEGLVVYEPLMKGTLRPLLAVVTHL